MQKLFTKEFRPGEKWSGRTNIFTLKHLEIMPMYQFFFTI